MADQALATALDHLVRGIVDHPDRVRVELRDTARGGVLEVRVHPSDLGRVIGRGGRTAQSLRTVVASLTQGERVRVDVIDTDDESEVDETGADAEPETGEKLEGAA